MLVHANKKKLSGIGEKTQRKADMTESQSGTGFSYGNFWMQFKPKGELNSKQAREIQLSRGLLEKAEKRYQVSLDGIKAYEETGLLESGFRGYAKGNEIHIDDSLPAEKKERTLLHEIGHVVQIGSGMAYGNGFLNDAALEKQADAGFAAPENFVMPSSNAGPIMGEGGREKCDCLPLLKQSGLTRHHGIPMGIMKEFMEILIKNKDKLVDLPSEFMSYYEIEKGIANAIAREWRRTKEEGTIYEQPNLEKRGINLWGFLKSWGKGLAQLQELAETLEEEQRTGLQTKIDGLKKEIQSLEEGTGEPIERKSEEESDEVEMKPEEKRDEIEIKSEEEKIQYIHRELDILQNEINGELVNYFSWLSGNIVIGPRTQSRSNDPGNNLDITAISVRQELKGQGSTALSLEEYPEMIESFIEQSPQITKLLLTRCPEMIELFIKQSSEIIGSLLEQSPEIIGSFLEQSPEMVRLFLQQNMGMIELLLRRFPQMTELLLEQRMTDAFSNLCQDMMEVIVLNQVDDDGKCKKINQWQTALNNWGKTKRGQQKPYSVSKKINQCQNILDNIKRMFNQDSKCVKGKGGKVSPNSTSPNSLQNIDFIKKQILEVMQKKSVPKQTTVLDQLPSQSKSLVEKLKEILKRGGTLEWLMGESISYGESSKWEEKDNEYTALGFEEPLSKLK
uniref:ImmA/IrrE family metallo-endopeptidase n=1 Tax=Agathobacter sp. TaxID=2021311 RepID=UPI004055A8B3